MNDLDLDLDLDLELGLGLGLGLESSPEMSARTATALAARLRRARRPGSPASKETDSDDQSIAGAEPVSGPGSRLVQLQLHDALVVPAGSMIRGHLRCRALLLVGDVVGNVHCTAGPVVIRRGATLKGRLVASGDVYVCGSVGDDAGGLVISTRGKLTLAPGSRVDGDVRSGRLDLYDGAMLKGSARGSED
jgi:cytoskeletal protein CcmA (bactofilin family)